MAEGKKSFILYSDLLPTIKKLVEKDRFNKTNNAGELFLHLLDYVCDNNPEPINDIVDLMFEPIKSQLKRDLHKWEEKSPQRTEKARIAGLASAEARKLKRELNSTTELKTQLNSTKSTVSVSGNVTVNEKPIVINNIEVRKLKFADTLKPFVQKYGKELVREFFNYWTEPNKSNTKFKQEMQSTWSTERRLDNWSKNSCKFDAKKETPKKLNL